jgi:hypothetical protein
MLITIEPYTTVSVLKKMNQNFYIVPLVGRLKKSLSSAGPINMPKDSEKILGKISFSMYYYCK